MSFIKKIIITVCLLFNPLVKGQTLFFDKYYKTGYDNLLTSNVLFLEDSTYTFLNYVKDSVTGQQNMALLKIDKHGNELLKKTHDFGFPYLSYFNGLRNFTSMSNSSMVSTSVTYTNSQATVIINKISKQTLDTIKNLNYYDGSYSYYSPNIIKVHNNKFFLIGNKFDAVNSWPFIFELDSNLVLKNTITCPNTQTLSTKIGFLDNVNKKLILGGNIGTSNTSFISIVDTLGNFLNTYINNTCSNFITNIIYSAFDNSYVAIGVKRTSIYGSQNMYRHYIIKYNATNLSLVWQKTYSKSNMLNFLYDAIVNPDGSIVAVGRYSDSLSNALTNINCNGILLKVRSNGDSLWMREFDNLNNTSGPSNNWYEGFYGVEKTSDGGYIMCGNAQQMPLAKAWVVKTDSLGCVFAGCSTASVEENSFIQEQLTVYPNPTDNFIYLNLPIGIANIDIEVVNTLGQCVAKHRSTIERINTENLPAGTYFIKVQSPHFLPYYCKFVKL